MKHAALALVAMFAVTVHCLPVEGTASKIDMIQEKNEAKRAEATKHNEDEEEEHDQAALRVKPFYWDFEYKRPNQV
ncbi:hypothetical protein CBER1_11820 [Cercospora berteroae]|uniref:Uncharacterized protein n=1 Tax=Cercospora berteroae TaxID=357750 RepID=A0A2S6CLD6_9PEZI|nr:hypothetical protein CBER1_11820 [Cercospora berteroae]